MHVQTHDSLVDDLWMTLECSWTKKIYTRSAASDPIIIGVSTMLRTAVDEIRKSTKTKSR